MHTIMLHGHLSRPERGKHLIENLSNVDKKPDHKMPCTSAS